MKSKSKSLKNTTSDKEIIEFLRDTAAVWIGKTPVTGQYVMILSLATAEGSLYAPYCISVTSLGVEIRYLKDHEIGKSMVKRFVPLLIPGVNDKTPMTDGSVLAYDSSFLSIESDMNLEMEASDYKYLPKEIVEETLDAMGADRTLYVYKENTFECQLDPSAFMKPLVRGYSNYDPEVLKHMHNTPGYAAMNISKELHDEIMSKLDLDEDLILQGPPSGGKTTAICAVLSKEEIPFMKISAHPNMIPDELVGSQGIDRTGLVKFIESIMALCARLGMVAVIDEGDTAIACWPTYNVLTDGSRYLGLSNGEIQEIHENFRVVITMNPGVSQPLPSSTRTRFSKITFSMPSEEQFTEWLEFDLDKTKNILSRKFYKALYEVFVNVSDICMTDKCNIDVAQRGFARFLKEVILYERRWLDNKVEPSLDLWIRSFNQNCYADCLLCGQSIEQSQYDEYVKASSLWIEKLYKIFHDDFSTNKTSSVGSIIIDKAVVTDPSGIAEELAEFLGDFALVFNNFKKGFNKLFKGGRK